MLLRIPGVLPPDDVRRMRAALADAAAPWVDGRATAGHQGREVKRNEQLAEESPLARSLGATVVAALERQPLFLAAALPSVIYPPLFNRYIGHASDGMHFGTHVDGAVRLLPGTGMKIRTDLSATLFLSDPADYDGGELQVRDQFGVHGVKLPAGDLVVYPATSLHDVTPITRGVRLACFFWIQSLVRDDAQRALLFDLDNAIQRLNRSAADDEARRSLVGVYHNLMRQWSET